MKRRPTASEGVAYQLADCAATPAKLPCSVVYYSPIQVRPVVVMREVSIDSLQQQLPTFWVESWEVCVFLWGSGVPSMRVTLAGVPRWVSPSLFSLSSFSRAPSPSPPLLLWPDGPLIACWWICGGGGGVSCDSLAFPSPPSPPVPVSYSPDPTTTPHRKSGE